MATINLRDKFVGALVGTMVGDALGAHLEGVPFGLVSAGQAGSRFGRYTDDTQMAIGIAESLIACRGFDADQMARQFAANLEPWRGYGGGALHALRLIAQGADWREANRSVFSAGSFGNGAAMRIAPVGALYHDNLPKLVKVAVGSSLITHAHPLGIGGGIVQATAVGLAVAAEPTRPPEASSWLDTIGKGLTDYPDFIPFLAPLPDLLAEQPEPREVVRRLGNNVTAQKSVPTALYSFLRNPASFAEATLYAVGLGGDADTIGAMTGAIAGGYHGVGNIPQEWLEKQERGEKGLEYIWKLGEQLYELWQRSD